MRESSDNQVIRYDTPFHALAGACELANAETLLSVFASSQLEVFPYQVAAARFVLGAAYLKGAVLCDEGSLGKTFEALLVIAQFYYEQRDRVLIVVPLPLLRQWREVLEERFSVPYEIPDETLPDGIVLTTYEWAAAHADELNGIAWDLTVFEEAHRLRKENQESAALKRAVECSKFKLLLTATPMQNSILDLHGLLSIIDVTALPSEKEFYRRYFRKPENYSELAALVSKYCFRTTRLEVGNYVKIPRRIVQTIQLDYSTAEEHLNRQLTDYVAKPELRAFPAMERYDLALMLFRAFSSSGAALRTLLDGALERVGGDAELSDIRHGLDAIETDTKMLNLLEVLCSGLRELKARGANQKALIFTENRSTQAMLEQFLTSHRYRVVCYHGGEDRAITEFREQAQILIATDAGAEGFNLEFCSLVINYDLPYNTLTLEQRINRCHRQGQKSDILIVNFLNRHNFADVRTFELINKRLLQFQGIIGLSDDVLGVIGNELNDTLKSLRPVQEIEAEFTATLAEFETPNRKLLEESQSTLFSSFTPEVARNAKLTPEYVEERSMELNNQLWALTKYFFARHPEFQFDDATRTLRCLGPAPKVFTGARLGRDEYSMSPDYRPRSGRHTLTGPLARNLIGELFWRGVPERGTIVVAGNAEPCRIALYENNLLIGKTRSGRILSARECRSLLALPVRNFTTTGETVGDRNRHLKPPQPDDLDALIAPPQSGDARPNQEHIQRQRELARQVDELRRKAEEAAGKLERATSRLEKLQLQKRHATAVKSWKEADQKLFLEAARLEIEQEKRNCSLDKPAIKRYFIVEIVN